MEISEHAKQRYAERIMEKTDKISISTFITTHEDKIRTDIEKMVEYGNLIYTGISTSQYNKEIVDVYLKDTWIIIIDNKRQKVITLYSIDLGVGKEFNELYINKLLEQLNEKKKKYAEVEKSVSMSNDELNILIKDNEEVITNYKKTIKVLEEQNQAYKDVINSSKATLLIEEDKIRSIIARLIGKKIF